MTEEKATTPILGVPISTLGMEGALNACAKRVEKGEGGYVCFANVHTVTESQSSPELFATLSSAFLAVADGLPLVWISRLKGKGIASRVCGPDFMQALVEEQSGIRHGFIGGMPGQAEKLVQHFGLEATCSSPPMRPFSEAAALEDWQTFLKKNGAKSPPQVVWVGLGAPKQELWMRTVSARVPNVLFMGVGAAFDFLTGSKKRAPQWMQKSGLEWLFRLVQEPRRLWRRYFKTNALFIAHLLREAFFGRPLKN